MFQRSARAPTRKSMRKELQTKRQWRLSYSSESTSNPHNPRTCIQVSTAKSSTAKDTGISSLLTEVCDQLVSSVDHPYWDACNRTRDRSWKLPTKPKRLLAWSQCTFLAGGPGPRRSICLSLPAARQTGQDLSFWHGVLERIGV